MIFAHILLPAMLLVICRSQQTPAHVENAYGNEEIAYSGNPTGGVVTTKNELLDRYRQLTAKSMLTLYDSCKLYKFLQNIQRNMETDIGEKSIGCINIIRKLQSLRKL